MSESRKGLLVVIIIGALLSFLMVRNFAERKQVAHKKPITVVQPKVTEASIALGDQYIARKKNDTGYAKLHYIRDIFLVAPKPFTFSGIEMAGFTPTDSSDNDEKYTLQLTANELLTMYIDDGKPIPVRRRLDPEGQVMLGVDYWYEYGYFEDREKIKITVKVPFMCTPELRKRNATYHISLIEMWANHINKFNDDGTIDQTRLPLITPTSPIKDFFVIRCGD